MRGKRGDKWIGAVLVCALAAISVAGVARGDLEALDAKAQYRDAVIDGARGRIFFSAYSHNEVREVDLQTKEILRAASVGKGPAALALSSDGSILACVNRLGSSVSVVRTADLSVIATVPCGKGACDITALPGGGFAVANAFSDSVTVIDPKKPDAPATIEGVASVPNGVAASGSLVAVTTRVPAQVLLYKSGAQTAASTVALPGAPVTVEAVPGGAFAVASEKTVYLVRGNKIAAEYACDDPIADVAAAGSDVLVLTAKQVLTLDAKLKKLSESKVSAPCVALAAGKDAIIAVAPNSRQWLAQIAAPAPAPKPQVAAKPVESKQSKEAAPKQTPAAPDSPEPERPAKPEKEKKAKPAAPKIVEAQPADNPPAKEPVAAKKPEPKAAKTSDTTQAKAKPVEDVKPSPKSVQRPRRMGLETKAPRFSRKAPDSMPVAYSGGVSLTQALAGGADFGAEQEGGFELPDWTDPLSTAKLRSEEGLRRREDSSQIFRGDVSGNLGNIRLRMDELAWYGEAKELEAKGNVHIEQNLSTLEADELYYKVPLETTEAVAPLMKEEDLDEQGRAKKLFALGHLKGTNVHIVEPMREVSAGTLDYDLLTRTGEITDARGHSGIFYFSAKRLRILGPASMDGEDVWVTTCDHDPPHYRIRVKKAAIEEGKSIIGSQAQLQLGPIPTPIFWPKWAHRSGKDRSLALDFDSGRRAELGYYLNFGQRFAVNKDMDLGFRLFPTEKEGVGFGLEGEYDFMNTPASPLFRGKGMFHSLYTTEDRGYFEMYHRQEFNEDTVALLQWEQWFDRTFLKDFYYDQYRDRTEPRTFANITRTKPGYIATATVKQTTNDFVSETEQIPEVTYHLLERRLGGRLYLSFDTVDGYYEREPSSTYSARMANVGRLSLDLDLAPNLSLTPFLETEATWYSNSWDDGDDDLRLSNTVGTTLQSRFHRSFPGALGFSGFKHVIVPSMTLSYRPEPTMGVEETPRFDAYDNVYGRSRLESKIDNIFYGRDASSEEVWQVARVSLYQGNDFWNEIRRAEDYEIEIDVRPRPWWGVQLVGERHHTSDEFDMDEPFFVERLFLQGYEDFWGHPFDLETAYRFNAVYGDYDRLLTYVYYDDLAQDGRFSARLGFAYTETQNRVFNREVLYGASYKISEKWALAFEHRYDFERSDLYHQEYALRRNLHCWDASLQIRDRESGWDFGVELSLTALPGTKVKF